MELASRRSREASVTVGRRRLHANQLGLTLTELLVALVILATIAASIGGAFAVGIRTLGPTGVRATLIGNHDLLAFEQQLGADVARASCLAAGQTFSQTVVPTNGCKTSTFPSKCGASTAYLLCVAWYTPGAACHTITYWKNAMTGAVERSDLLPPSTTVQVSTPSVTTGPSVTVNPSWNAYLVSAGNSSYQWVSQVDVTITQSGSSIAAVTLPKTTLHLVPLVKDPNSPLVTLQC